MKNAFVLLLFGIVVLLLINCEKNYNELAISGKNQKIYFQYDYVNYAWGFQHSGWFVDSSGNVYCYHQPEDWIYQDSLGFISQEDMENNILKTDSICYVIDKKVLVNKIKMIQSASKGKISEPVHEMYDAGSYTYSGFLYNKNTKTYQKILLKQVGDFRIENSSPASVKLYDWLEEINHSVQW